MNDLENHVICAREEKQIAVISCGRRAAEPGHDAALNAGFFDRSHFSRAFRDLYGASPSEYRKTP